MVVAAVVVLADAEVPHDLLAAAAMCRKSRS
jgi:hypothetical protein